MKKIKALIISCLLVASLSACSLSEPPDRGTGIHDGNWVALEGDEIPLGEEADFNVADSYLGLGFSDYQALAEQNNITLIWDIGKSFSPSKAMACLTLTAIVWRRCLFLLRIWRPEKKPRS